MQSVKFAVGVALLCTASTQPFAVASPTAVPNLAFIRLPGFSTTSPAPSPFEFRNVEIPAAFALQGATPIPMEWWEQGSDSPLAIVIGNAEGTRNLDGSKRSAYYWHTDPGNGADNFGSFSFQHLSGQEKQAALSQGSSQELRAIAKEQALPEIADQRQLEKLRRFHDLLLIQAQKHDMQLTELELINGLDLATQSELAGLDAWGYVDRLAQAKETLQDADEQIIQARTWSYWDPVDNRWAASGLGNAEYLIRRDQTRRFDALKQALQVQHQSPSMLQTVDIAWLPEKELDQLELDRGVDQGDDIWAIAQLDTENPLGGVGFHTQPLQLERPHDGLDALRAEMDLEPVLGLVDAVAQASEPEVEIAQAEPRQDARNQDARNQDIRNQQDDLTQLVSMALEVVPDELGQTAPPTVMASDLDFKAALATAEEMIRPQLSVDEGVEVALRLERPLELNTRSPVWDSMAITPEEFALATGVAIASADLPNAAFPNNVVPQQAAAILAEPTDRSETELIAEASQPVPLSEGEPTDSDNLQVQDSAQEQGSTQEALVAVSEVVVSEVVVSEGTVSATATNKSAVSETTIALEAMQVPPNSVLSNILIGTSQLVAELKLDHTPASLLPVEEELEHEVVVAVGDSQGPLTGESLTGEALTGESPTGERMANVMGSGDFVQDPFAEPLDEGYLNELNHRLNRSDEIALAIQPLMPESLRSLPTEPSPLVSAEPPRPEPEPLAPHQPFKRTPELAKAVTAAHVHAVEPLVLDRIEEERFLNLADGLKESPIAVTANSIGLAAQAAEMTVAMAEPLQIRIESPDTPSEIAPAEESVDADALSELESVPEAIAPLLVEPLAIIANPVQQSESESLDSVGEGIAPMVDPSDSERSGVAVESPIPEEAEATLTLDETIQYFEEDVFAEVTSD